MKLILLRRCGLQLSELAADALQRRLGVREVEPARRGTPLQLSRVQRRRQVHRHLREDPVLASGLALLDPVPVAQDLARRLGLRVAKHVRVAADQLLQAVLGDLS